MANIENVSAEILNAYPQINCITFRCTDELSKYTDSMMFDSHDDEIAYAEFSHNSDIMNIRLEVNGYVKVDYKGSIYCRFSDFPTELQERIKNHPNDWSNDYNDIYIDESNWFEYLFGPKLPSGTNTYQDGEIYEEDLSTATPQEIFNDMVLIAIQYFGYELPENED